MKKQTLLFILIGSLCTGIPFIARSEEAVKAPSNVGQQQEIIQLRSTLADTQKKLETAQKNFDQCDSARRDFEKRAQAAEKKLPELQAKNEKLEQQLKTCKDTIGQLEATIKELRGKLAVKEGEIAQLKKNKASLEKKLSSGNDYFNETIKKLESDRDRYKDDYKFYKKGYIAVSIVLYSLVAVAILIGGIVVMVRLLSKKCVVPKNNVPAIKKTEMASVQPPTTAKSSPPLKEQELRCPLCGWKYKPGEKVCKNCRTQF